MTETYAAAEECQLSNERMYICLHCTVTAERNLLPKCSYLFATIHYTESINITKYKYSWILKYSQNFSNSFKILPLLYWNNIAEIKNWLRENSWEFYQIFHCNENLFCLFYFLSDSIISVHFSNIRSIGNPYARASSKNEEKMILRYI